MSTEPPPFTNYLPVTNPDIWEKLRKGDLEAHVYSGEAPGDFEPVPIPAAAFVIADEARTDEELGFCTQLRPFQILWIDSDSRRRGNRRTRMRVPHWVYVKKAAPQAVTAPLDASCHGRRRLTKQSAVEWVRSYISSAQNPSMPGIDAHAKADGIIGGRTFYRDEYKKQMAAIGIATTQGRRPNHRRD